MLRDTALLWRIEMTVGLRNRSWLVMGLIQPVMYLLLFGPLLVPVAKYTPGFPAGSAWANLAAGLAVQIALFNSALSGFSLLSEHKAGVLERMRVTPGSRPALLLGRVLANVTQSVTQALVVILLAMLLFRLDAPLLGILGTLVIVALVGLTFAAFSSVMALKLKNEPAFSSMLNVLLLPLILLSGIFVPITVGLAPDWLYTLSRFNPLAHLVELGRSMLRGEVASSSVLSGAAMLAVMCGVSVWWGARTYSRANL